MAGKNGGDYIVEMIQVGGYVKVSAVDAVSGLEVSIVGDPSAPRAQLELAAIRKLEYVLAKKTGRKSGRTTLAANKRKPGIVV